MKTLQLTKKKEDVVVNGQTLNLEISTIDLLKLVINAPVQGGYDVAGMLKRVKLLDKVEQAEKDKVEAIDLDEKEYQSFVEFASNAKWTIVSREIAEFLNFFGVTGE